MRPRVRSYGLSSMRTLSPTRILTKFLRILPLIVASTGSCVSGASLMAHRNMALGSDSKTTPSTSITSSLTFRTRSVLLLRSFPSARAAFFPNSTVCGDAVADWDETRPFLKMSWLALLVLDDCGGCWMKLEVGRCGIDEDAVNDCTLPSIAKTAEMTSSSLASDMIQMLL